MNRRRRAALALLATLAVTTLVVGVAAQRTPGSAASDECALDAYAVTATDQNASEAESVVRYGTLPPAQRALVDRAVANEGEEVPLRGETERAAARALADDGARTLRNGTVYLDGTGARCSWVAGAPLWLDPLLFPFVLLYYLFTGPLLWLVVLGVAGAVAYGVGEWARY